MAIGLSNGGRTLYCSKSFSHDLLVATADGAFHLTRAGRGKPWKVSQRYLEGHHVSALLVESDIGMILAGMHDGGVAVSEDFGRRWNFRNRGLESENVYCMDYVKSGNSAKLYIGTEPARLLVSEDLGGSWHDLASLRSVSSVHRWIFPAPPHIAHVKHVSFDPKNSNIIYASVEQGGLFKSLDAGASWKELEITHRDEYSRLFINDDAHRLVIRPSSPSQIYLTTGYGFYRSFNSGDSWENISERIVQVGYPDLLVCHPNNEDMLFLAGAETHPGIWLKTKRANSQIARSRDGGDTWEVLKGGIPEPLKANFEAMTLEACNGSCALFVGNTDGDVYCSEDEGESWTKIIKGLPPISKSTHYKLLSS